MLGTPIVGAFEHYLRKYGSAAGHEVVNRMPARFRGWLSPHAPAMGILGARWYPYAFCGDLIRTAGAVARVADEDAFVRELACAGIDASVGTVARVLLRYAATPKSLAARAQEVWDMFHDAGRVLVVAEEREYVVTISDWTNHDGHVCRISMEVRRRLIERTGRTVEARRDRCVSFGHDVCVIRLKW